ncbi:MAG: NUDIX hydrolase [Candidatus Magasanikbacteria bacterium]|nr:NUDIX hydrolase [Candidatus Magasanikbacteria bacterium]
MNLPAQTIIASGPVIIEDGKVLLNKEQKDDGRITPWLFPGGEVESFDISLEDACKREVMEEMGIEVEIIQPLKPMLVFRPDQPEKLVILIHYLAKRIGEIKPGSNIVEWEWFDINNLPEDCAPNVIEVIKEYKQINTLN